MSSAETCCVIEVSNVVYSAFVFGWFNKNRLLKCLQ
jgi:hypothetical protein